MRASNDGRQTPLLHHDGDLLSQWRAAYRPRLRGDRDRRDRPLHAARRLRCLLPDRHRRARHQDAPDRRQGGPHATRTGRTQRAALPGDGETAQPVERRIHPHHRGSSSPRVDRHLGQDGRERRHLSRQVFRLVLGARRGLLRRERDQAERAGRAGRSAGHAGRVGRGGELLLQALGLSGQAAEALRATGLRAAEGAAQRSRQLRQGRIAGSLDLAHHLRLGRQGAQRSQARDVCVGRCAHQLHHGGRLSGHRQRQSSSATGRPICTSSARTSCASTRSTGRPS